MRKSFLLISCILLLSGLSLKAQTIKVLAEGKATSIRGLSVVDDYVAWISGSKGTVAITKDGGTTWEWQQVKGFEKSDFRDIEAFSDKEAVIMSSGTPAVILKTIDGGANWQVKYRNNDTTYFLDAMDFDGKKRGYVLGDPINGKFLLMETTDGAETWHSFKNAPTALPGEAAFAASGTCLRFSNGIISIATGGTNSRYSQYPVKADTWISSNLPLTDGKQSRGAFSIAHGKFESIIVGGDYSHDNKPDSVAYLLPRELSANKANTPKIGPAGYQSCVEWLNDQTFLSTGTPGSNLTSDGGVNWKQIDKGSYNVCRKARHGTLVLLAGDKGKIGILKL